MPKAVLTITLEDDGKINVNGPVQDKILCFGLLKIAEFAVKEYVHNKVVVPNFIFPKDLKGNGNA